MKVPLIKTHRGYKIIIQQSADNPHYFAEIQRYGRAINSSYSDSTKNAIAWCEQYIDDIGRVKL